MNRLAAFTSVCGAAILFMLVAYIKLSETDLLSVLDASKPRKHLLIAKNKLGYDARNPSAYLSLAGLGNDVKDDEKNPQNTVRPFGGDAEPDVNESGSEQSSSVSEYGDEYDDDNTLPDAHRDHRTEQRGTESSRKENDGKPIVVVVLARMRTGSSLVGELFNQNPSLFYVFEPLHAIDHFIRKHWSAADHRQELSTSLFRGLSKCEFTPDFVDSVAHWGLGKFKSSGLRPICRATMGCLKASPSMLSKECRSFGGRVGMKTIRADLSMVQSLVEEDHYNVKVIHLVRDPRGTANSRKSYYNDRSNYVSKIEPGKINMKNFTLKTLQLLEENPTAHVNTIVKYCKWMQDNILLVKAKPSWLQNRYMFVRYEDMALDPLRKSREIYDFVGMTMPSNVREWVLNNTDEHNSEHVSNTFGMQKNSKEVMQSWRHSLSYEEVTQVQKICGRAMDFTGYRRLLSSEQLQDADFNTFDPIEELQNFHLP